MPIRLTYFHVTLANAIGATSVYSKVLKQAEAVSTICSSNIKNGDVRSKQCGDRSPKPLRSNASRENFGAVDVATGILAGAVKRDEQEEEENSHGVACSVRSSCVFCDHCRFDAHHDYTSSETNNNYWLSPDSVEQNRIDPVQKCGPTCVYAVWSMRVRSACTGVWNYATE